MKGVFNMPFGFDSHTLPPVFIEYSTHCLGETESRAETENQDPHAKPGVRGTRRDIADGEKSRGVRL
jgi:hypothetical protein